ncbi:2-amino-4-hydroxy-6-hydroxymethyldihydropteridine diphosphokinase [Desertivirga xinjiangensis]|uniref:2-amino-4-hydroxy-6- hydroxymethyldihydropteridine diphosphokinase n=1 Tax=Desertivirga xinjiangensis TaxID=539206 RepID=UPI00210CE56F|nr:2-amino-4-hydroxy-6-hydroxymethyldihydropteridine diphosphokinase [Pedobacter xinjiangensis]
MQRIYLLLGSNLGERDQVLHKAAEAISERVGDILQKSSLYETESWGKTGQPHFLNQVICIESGMSALKVLKELLEIENLLGRKRLEKWGSRIIDIDILFYGSSIINEPDLTVPHPYFQERRFAVMPMLEIAPDFEHPVLHKTISIIALELTDELSVHKV